MPGILATLLDAFQESLERQRKRPFLEGVMAACALLATTDGEVSFAEEVRVDQILQTLDQLKVFDPHVGVDLFKDYSEAILADPETGHDAAMAKVADVARDPECGALLIRVCLAISEADGELSLADQIEIVSMCSRFGIDPGDCGLYIEMPIDDFLSQTKPAKEEA